MYGDIQPFGSPEHPVHDRDFFIEFTLETTIKCNGSGLQPNTASGQSICSQLVAGKAYHRIAESQNHRMFDVGRGLSRCSGSTVPYSSKVT